MVTKNVEKLSLSCYLYNCLKEQFFSIRLPSNQRHLFLMPTHLTLLGSFKLFGLTLVSLTATESFKANTVTKKTLVENFYIPAISSLD